MLPTAAGPPATYPRCRRSAEGFEAVGWLHATDGPGLPSSKSERTKHRSPQTQHQATFRKPWDQTRSLPMPLPLVVIPGGALASLSPPVI